MLQVTDADLKHQDGFLTLDIMGYAPTPGWTDIQLSATQYFTEPEDGIQDVTVHGTPPIGYQPMIIVGFFASLRLEEPDWLLGVRLLAMDGTPLRVLGKTVLGQEPVGSDWLSVVGASLFKDKLFVDSRYGGGCKTHKFQLNWDGSVIKTNLPGIVLDLSHDSLGDPCKAMLTVHLQFDLSVVLDSPEDYKVILKTNTSEIIVHSPEY